MIFGRFEKLKKDAAFAPKQRPSSWRVSSHIKGARDLKIFLAGSWRVVLLRAKDLTFLKGVFLKS